VLKFTTWQGKHIHKRKRVVQWNLFKLNLLQTCFFVQFMHVKLRFLMLGLYLRFILNRILFYSEFNIDMFTVYYSMVCLWSEGPYKRGINVLWVFFYRFFKLKGKKEKFKDFESVLKTIFIVICYRFLLYIIIKKQCTEQYVQLFSLFYFQMFNER
jgi:hypothetical protein